MHFDELRRRYECNDVIVFNLIRKSEGKQNENTIGEQYTKLCSEIMGMSDSVKLKDIDDDEEFEIIKIDDKGNEDSSFYSDNEK